MSAVNASKPLEGLQGLTEAPEIAPGACSARSTGIVAASPAFEIVQGPQLQWVPRVWSWCRAFRARVFDDYAPVDAETFIWELTQRLARAGAFPYWVTAAGDVGGLALFEYSRPGVFAAHVLYKKAMWGSAFTLESSRVIAAQFLSSKSEVRRLEFLCFADNSAIVGLARKLGARDEGLMRGYTMRGGKPADMKLLGLLREEFRAGN